MKITFIGAGNVSWHLTRTLEQKGYTVMELYSQHLNKAEKLSRQLLCTQATDDLNFSKSKSEVFFICVPDDALSEVINQLILPPEALVVHTSGSVPMSVLERLSTNYGIFYPLQTFNKDVKVDLNQTVFCLEANTKENYTILEGIAKDISANVYPIDSEQRKVLHISAVFACNFINHLLGVSKNILNENNLSFDLLKPLIVETIQKALANDPFLVQTGPAKRKDYKTIEKHLNFLKESSYSQQIYRLLSDSIIAQNDK